MSQLPTLQIPAAARGSRLRPQQKRFNTLLRQIEQARETLGELICESAKELLQAREGDAEIQALFARHARVDFAEEQREMALAMKELAEQVTGLDLGDDEAIHTDDHLFERMREAFAQQEAAQRQEDEARSARRPRSAARPRRSRPRSRCARSTASWPVRCIRTARPTNANAPRRSG